MAAIHPDLRRAVFEALDNAIANGFTMTAMTNDQIAVDLKDCDADLENVAESDLVPIIEEWRAQS